MYGIMCEVCEGRARPHPTAGPTHGEVGACGRLQTSRKKGGRNLPREETIAGTLDKEEIVFGQWIVKWQADGTGACRHTGKVARYFGVHEELLGKNVRQSCTFISKTSS
ncbi:hypothetical protein BDW22DRAFT_1199627 [Trametopsis cervina]|nr:hypothetical protein BDW22DRAFT_1199627 [Trametopsis cervina]